VFEKQQAKARERQQLQRELSNNWGKLQNAAGTVVNARKEKIKARIRKREERMRIENIDRVVNRDMKRESKKLRAKALNRTMFMATVLLMVSRDDGKGCSVVCDEWFSHFMNLEFLLFSCFPVLLFSCSPFLLFSFSLFLSMQLIYMTICQKSAEVWICTPEVDGTSKVRGTNMVCNFEEPYMTPVRCSLDECVDPKTCPETFFLDTYDGDTAPRYQLECCESNTPAECNGDPSSSEVTGNDDPLKCSVPTIRGVGLVNWTTPYTLPSGLNQSTVWDHVIGPNECSGAEYNKASGCEEGVEYDAIGLNNEKPTSSPCPQRQRMHATLTLLFQWVEHTESDNGGEFMSERGTETSC